MRGFLVTVPIVALAIGAQRSVQRRSSSGRTSARSTRKLIRSEDRFKITRSGHGRTRAELVKSIPLQASIVIALTSRPGVCGGEGRESNPPRT